MPKQILKSLDEVALILTLRPAFTERGRQVQERALFRVECQMWISEIVKGK